MSEYSQLKSSINRVIKTNNNREITGQILQSVLNSMVNSLGANYHFAGLASPNTDPGTPDQNVFYMASEEGKYINFGNVTLNSGLSFLMWRNNQWIYETLSISDATKEWVNQNYVSIAFFRKLFCIYDENDTEILPNDLTSVVDNIKATVGLWTEQYLTALGFGKGGSGGVSSLSELSDVQLTSLTNGQALIYNSTLGKWVNGEVGLNIAQMWNALAASTNEQINASHLTNALTPYATTNYVSGQITDTRDWVGEQITNTRDWVSLNFISVSFFNRLFRAYNGNTLVNANDITSTIDNIKAMFGFWTEFYLSALGNGIESGAAISLGMLSDVDVTGASNGNVLGYQNGTWMPITIQAGTDMSSVWSALAASTNEQINASHLNNALSSYNPTSNFKTINNNSIIGTGNINISVSGDYLPLTGGILTGALTVQDDIGVSGSGDVNGSFSVGANNPTQQIFTVHCESMFLKRIVISGANCVADGFYKSGSSDSYVLLGGGGHSTLKTINGNSIIGTGNISISTAGNYLPLTGGTVTGATQILYVKIEKDNEINCYRDDGVLYVQESVSGHLTLCRGGGNVGIGGIASTHKLTVHGTISATSAVYATNFEASSSCDFNGDVSIGTNASNNILTLQAWLNSTGAANFSGNVSASGFLKSGSNNNYVLLGGGGHKLLSEIGGGGGGIVLKTVTFGGATSGNGNVAYNFGRVVYVVGAYSNTDDTIVSPYTNGKVNWWFHCTYDNAAATAKTNTYVSITAFYYE